jgi:hypothetical protein
MGHGPCLLQRRQRLHVQVLLRPILSLLLVHPKRLGGGIIVCLHGGGRWNPESTDFRNHIPWLRFFLKWLDVTMTEPLPLLIESSIEIALDYLDRAGELGDAMVAGRFLADTIESMVRRGERRRLMLANKAITAYQQFRRQSEHPIRAWA